MKKLLVTGLLFSTLATAKEATNTATTVSASSAPTKEISAPSIANFSTKPLNLLLGEANAAVDFRTFKPLTLGTRFSYSSDKKDDVSATAYSVGLRANYFFSGQAFTDSAYVGALGEYISAKASAGKITAQLNMFSGAGLLGYAWFWNSGFNMNLGGGARYTAWPKTISAGGYTMAINEKPLSFMLEYSLGFAF
jgi:hypothetical protein